MKKHKYNFIFLFFLFIIMSSDTFADYAIVQDKATGKILISQDNPNDITLDYLKKDIQTCGLDKNSVEIKKVSDEEYNQIKFETETKIEIERKKQEQEQRKQKEYKIKIKLGLSDQDFQDLKDVLRD